MKWSVRLNTLLVACLLLAGCHTKLYTHTDPDHKVSISYPGNLDLFKDKDVLGARASQDATTKEPVDQPELLFVLTTIKRSQITAAVHLLPDGSELTADQYYEVSTAKELETLGVEIVEPKSEEVIAQRSFLRVGFKMAAGDKKLRSRIYQYLHPESGKIAVVTIASLDSEWENERPALESVVKSLKLDW